jgi:hypothetical protein
VAGEAERRCNNCAAFVRVREHPELGRVGECALEVFAPPLTASSTCSRWRPKGGGAPPPRARAAGEPRRYRDAPSAPPRASPATAAPRPVAAQPLPPEIDIDMDIKEFRRVLRQVIAEELGVGEVQLGRRWMGGELVLRPGAGDTQEKRVPLEAFFHKIVMIRDKLRVLEARINAHDRLSDEDKVQLQQYVTACYGTLTTFNVLFAEREDWFATK